MMTMALPFGSTGALLTAYVLVAVIKVLSASLRSAILMAPVACSLPLFALGALRKNCDRPELSCF